MQVYYLKRRIRLCSSWSGRPNHASDKRRRLLDETVVLSLPCHIRARRASEGHSRHSLRKFSQQQCQSPFSGSVCFRHRFERNRRLVYRAISARPMNLPPPRLRRESSIVNNDGEISEHVRHRPRLDRSCGRWRKLDIAAQFTIAVMPAITRAAMTYVVRPGRLGGYWSPYRFVPGVGSSRTAMGSAIVWLRRCSASRRRLAPRPNSARCFRARLPNHPG